jgi:transcriptional regulator with XRE-family HTH domain
MAVVTATLQNLPPFADMAEGKGGAMGASAEDSRLVDEDAGRSQGDLDSRARGAAIKAQREAAEATLVQLAHETGLSRQTIARAEEGHASESTYRTLEHFFKNEISGPATPDVDVLEVNVEGIFGVARVAVKGSANNPEEIRSLLRDILRDIRDTTATDDG